MGALEAHFLLAKVVVLGTRYLYRSSGEREVEVS